VAFAAAPICVLTPISMPERREMVRNGDDDTGDGNHQRIRNPVVQLPVRG